MQFNYHTLKRLSQELHALLQGAVWNEAFSQQKDELIIVFRLKSGDVFHIKCSLGNDFHCLSFPNEFHRGRKNVITLFSSLEKGALTQVEQYDNERAFSFHFENGSCLLFKLFGSRSNIILFEKETPPVLFKKKLLTDNQIIPNRLHRRIERNKDSYIQNPDLNTFSPTLGPIPKKFLQQKGFSNLSANSQWDSLIELELKLKNNPFYLLKTEQKPVLSLVPIDGVDSEVLGQNAISAINQFHNYFTKEFFFKLKKGQATNALNQKIKKSENYIVKTRSKLTSLEDQISPNQVADIIMANLHKIKHGASSVKLMNFYTNDEIEIKLKKEESPQKNAERLYRKSKNRKIEIDTLLKNIRKKEDNLFRLFESKEQIEKASNMKELRNLLKSEKVKSKDQEPIKPYKEFEFNRFKIWVGKNAKANDQLTLKHTFKEDLWLHVKDIPGSHVVVKFQSGNKIPNSVIECAAEIAAYYSKRKTDSLVPVIYTPAKHVRKRKGSPAGSVIVERENVIMVTPKLPINN